MSKGLRVAPAIVSVATCLMLVTSARAADIVVPFASTGAEQQFDVPAGVRSLRVVAVGGVGGRGWTNLNNGAFVSIGGAGARVAATLPVIPGQKLFVTVGGNGPEGSSIAQAGAFGGGGGRNHQAGRTSGGGGGASDVRTCAAAACPLTGGAADPRLVVAAGGGGGGSAVSSGGGTGGDAGPAPQGGGAGTAVAGGGGGQGGGAGTDAVGGAAGVAGVGTQTSPGQQGSVGVGGASQAIGITTQPGGGGGGGWFGGGSGGNGAWTNGQVGGGGGGGAGSSRVTSAASDVQIAVDASRAPSVTIAYTPDTTAPEIDLRTPVDGATYTPAQTVPAAYTCADPAGVTRCDGDVPAAALVDTSTAGEHTFTVTATDAAGNTQARTVRYTVSPVIVSPIVSPAPTVAPTPAPTVTPSGPPRLTVSARRRSLNTVVSSRGFLLSVRCDVRCDVSASAMVGRRMAGSGTRQLSAGTTALLRIRLTSSAVKSFKRRNSATFAVAVRATAAGLTTTRTVRLTARRTRR